MTRNTITQLVAMTGAATLLFFLGHRTPAIVVAVLGGLTLLLALFAPGPLHTLQTAIERLVTWLATGLGLALLTLIYFTVFLGGALWLRLRSIDPLNRTFPGRSRSNWIERTGYGTDDALYSKLYSRPHGEEPPS